MSKLTVIMAAAGRSVRFGGAKNKLYERLGGRSVIQRAMDPFLQRADVVQIIIACTNEHAVRDALDPKLDPRIRFCHGGLTRAHSVHNGVRAAGGETELVAIHDAARPLLSQAIIERTVAAALEHGAAVPAMPVHLTIKQATGPLPARVLRTIPRQMLWAMQTPQIIRRADLLEAFERCPVRLEQVTDDVQLIELAGGDVWLVEGDERNIKITTQMDLIVAERLLEDNA